MIRTKSCGTAAKAGGNGENKPHPIVKGIPYLLTKEVTRADLTMSGFITKTKNFLPNVRAVTLMISRIKD